MLRELSAAKEIKAKNLTLWLYAPTLPPATKRLLSYYLGPDIMIIGLLGLWPPEFELVGTNSAVKHTRHVILKTGLIPHQMPL